MDMDKYAAVLNTCRQHKLKIQHIVEITVLAASTSMRAWRHVDQGNVNQIDFLFN